MQLLLLFIFSVSFFVNGYSKVFDGFKNELQVLSHEYKVDYLESLTEQLLNDGYVEKKGVDEVLRPSFVILQAIIEKIPAPTGNPEADLRALIITSIFDNHQGAIAYVRVIDGELTKQPLKLKMVNFK